MEDDDGTSRLGTIVLEKYCSGDSCSEDEDDPDDIDPTPDECGPTLVKQHPLSNPGPSKQTSLENIPAKLGSTAACKTPIYLDGTGCKTNSSSLLNKEMNAKKVVNKVRKMNAGANAFGGRIPEEDRGVRERKRKPVSRSIPLGEGSVSHIVLLLDEDEDQCYTCCKVSGLNNNSLSLIFKSGISNITR